MKLAEEQFSDQYQSVCSNDADCGETEICVDAKAQWDDTLQAWSIYSHCDEDDYGRKMEICELIGDFTIYSGENYEEKEAPYSYSFNCERYSPVNIGGAHSIAATFFAILAILLLVN